MIHSLRFSWITKRIAIAVIFIDFVYRITCILSYNATIQSQYTLFALYSLNIVISFMFISIIMILRISNKGMVIDNNSHDDYLYFNGMGHINLLHLVFIIYFVSKVVFSALQISTSDLNVRIISIWIESILSIFLNFIVLYHLIPPKKAAISDNIYNSNTTKSRIESLSKSLPPEWSKKSNSYKNQNEMYCNINESHSLNKSPQINSAYTKGGFDNKEENTYQLPDNAVSEASKSKSMTATSMKQESYEQNQSKPTDPLLDRQSIDNLSPVNENATSKTPAFATQVYDGPVYETGRRPTDSVNKRSMDSLRTIDETVESTPTASRQAMNIEPEHDENEHQPNKPTLLAKQTTDSELLERLDFSF